ncbi:MAG: hypothetical protein JWO92_1513 [Chitinophagaceae bacterium]|nr:hypothetical protein [Chitinophagaceae bacterium]
MSTKGWILIVVDIIIAIVLIKIIFKTFKDFLKGIIYFILPNWIFITKKDFDISFNYSHRFIFWGAILFVIVLIEFAIFY